MATRIVPIPDVVMFADYKNWLSIDIPGFW
jgi:hypothetical protein